MFLCTISILYRDGLEDPLDDAGLVQQQLDQLSTIGRCEYEKTCALLVQLFDQSAQSYQELLQSTNSSTMDIAVQEGELTTPHISRCTVIDYNPYITNMLSRSFNVAGVHHWCGHWRKSVLRQHGWARCHGWGACVSVSNQHWTQDKCLASVSHAICLFRPMYKKDRWA